MSKSSTDSKLVKLPPQIDYTKKLMNFGGINPFNQNIFTRMFQTFAIIIYGIHMILHIMELTINFNGVETIGKSVYSPCIFIKFAEYLVYSFNQKSIRAPFEMLPQFWSWDKFGPTVERELQKTSNKLFWFIKFYVALIIINCINMIVVPYMAPAGDLIYFQYDYCDIDNNFFCYHINFALQIVILMFVQVPSLYAFDVMFVAFTCQIYIQFELIKIALVECNISMENHIALKEIVDQHNVIIDFIKAYDKFTSRLFLAKYTALLGQMICALYMLSVEGFPPSSEAVSVYGVLFISFMLMVYMYSFGGAIVYDQSLSVAEAAYTVNWTQKGQIKLRQDIAFVIFRAQKPEQITAAHFCVNMDAFVNTMQNAFSVYGLLVTIAENSEKF